MHGLEDVEGGRSLLIGLGHFFLCFYSLLVKRKTTHCFGRLIFICRLLLGSTGCAARYMQGRVGHVNPRK